MNILLIGFMGCGKTTVGKKLSQLLHCKFIDTDNCFEKQHQISVFDYISLYGEEKFRLLEQQVFTKIVSENSNAVISTGGGLPCYSNNMEVINQHGISVYIKMSVESLFKRLLYSLKKRPMIENFENETELEEYIANTLKEREHYYNKARHIIKGENLNINELIQLLKY